MKVTSFVARSATYPSTSAHTRNIRKLKTAPLLRGAACANIQIARAAASQHMYIFVIYISSSRRAWIVLSNRNNHTCARIICTDHALLKVIRRARWPKFTTHLLICDLGRRARWWRETTARMKTQTLSGMSWFYLRVFFNRVARDTFLPGNAAAQPKNFRWTTLKILGLCNWYMLYTADGTYMGNKLNS